MHALDLHMYHCSYTGALYTYYRFEHIYSVRVLEEAFLIELLELNTFEHLTTAQS